MSFAYYIIVSFIITLFAPTAKSKYINNGPYALYWEGPIYGNSGFSTEMHEYIRGFSHLNPKLLGRLYPIGIHHGDGKHPEAVSGWPKDLVDASEWLARRVSVEGSERMAVTVCVCHSEPGAWSMPSPLFPAGEPCPLPGCNITIGRSMFETDRLPTGWTTRLNQMQEIWVPTQLHRDIFFSNGVLPEKLRVVPEAIDSRWWDPLKASPNFFEPIGPSVTHVLKRCGFRFLSVFKWEERKGWKELVEAFYSEFGSSKNARYLPNSPKDAKAEQNEVCLIIKTQEYHSDISDGDDDSYIDVIESHLKKKFGSKAWRGGPFKNVLIHVLSEHVPATKMPSLYASVDALVQPSRGEGWGRPHIEAMAMALPVIATNWSGNTEFMKHEHNSLLIQVDKLEEIKDGAFKGHKWAIPSVTHLRHLMRLIVNNQTYAGELGDTARRDVVRLYDSATVSGSIVKTVSELIEAFREKHNANESSSDNSVETNSPTDKAAKEEL